MVNETINKNNRFSTGLQNILALTCAAAVANLFYDQVLLSDIVKHFSIQASEAGLLLSVIQIGYTLGLLFVVPLGDRFNRRILILGSMLLSAVWLVLMTWVSSFQLLLVIGFLLGFSTVSAQLIVPFVASNALLEQRGKLIGHLLTGIFMGVLVGRVFGGWIGQLFGWHAVHWTAAFILICIASYLFWRLPEDQAPKQASYKEIIGSLLPLIKKEPILRETLVLGSAAFAAFNVFWVPLALLLNGEPYHFGSGMTGTFGFVGIAGALAAGFTGKLSNRPNVRGWNITALFVMVLSLVFFGFGWHSLPLLILVTFFLDVGSRMNMSLNQGRLYQLDPGKHSRLNALFMVGYYLGGSIGSWVGSQAYHLVGAVGMVISGCAFLLLAICYEFIKKQKNLMNQRRRFVE
ncbi:MFS transporter [Sporolactobacillus laevolacticus]|uniref:MFS transporter n=1 Tax=Sporolactobacillus laevolacticus TaxID=33018 RepID=UPI0025B48C51|nr:MFS transporter [Sporolactobacillus laevolacticus]MDN3956412.1 MFS transporter [Sporolactobacillus laevolacticus]